VEQERPDRNQTLHYAAGRSRRPQSRRRG
jgi:hypothetical protein